MSSPASSIVADVALSSSMQGLQWAFWLHILPAAALPLAVSSKPIAIILLVLIFASWRYVRRHAALGFGPRAITRILARDDGSWWIETEAEGGQAAQLLPDSVVTAGLLVLRFHPDNGKSATRLVLGDEAPTENLRRLRVRLSTGAKG